MGLYKVIFKGDKIIDVKRSPKIFTTSTYEFVFITGKSKRTLVSLFVVAEKRVEAFETAKKILSEVLVDSQ